MSKVYGGFEDAARATLTALQSRIPFAAWMITRLDGEQGAVLYRRDRRYGLKEGWRYAWADSLCAPMLRGDGPRFAADTDAFPCYRTARLAQALPIRAYFGTPLFRGDGRLFGSLCAIDPQPQSVALALHEPMLDLAASLLSTICELDAARHAGFDDRPAFRAPLARAAAESARRAA